MSRDDVDDELMQQVMAQLGTALGDLDTDSLRDAVQEGLREAMQALDAGAEAAADAVDAADTGLGPDGKPRVVVLDGGLSDPRPDPHPEDETVSTGRASVSVRVRRSLQDGWLAPQGDWQTVYAGPQVATYRLAVTSGQVEVSADDQLVATLRAGQSCDVAGSRIVVRGDGDGSYRAL